MGAITYTPKQHGMFNPQARLVLPGKQVNIAGSTGYSLLSRTRNGTFTGTATKHGVAVANAVVHLYDRNSGERIQSAITASDGTFTFTGIDKSTAFSSKYYYVALYPDTDLTIQAIVYDRKTPA